ncbi:MAG: hypothetical protein KDD40_12090, partial [Bdellovibrionales bacterium]|nr:hypothetical protein [Bdellovibrionales bacterium]
MENNNKIAKLFIASVASLYLLACEGQVEFAEIPQAVSLCQEEQGDCIDPVVIDEPQDGYVLKTRNDSVLQEGSGGKVDILVVVDNSISMFEEQKKMGDRFGDFVKTLGDIDWQLAFTTTDARTNITGDRFGGNLLNLVGAPGKILNKETSNLISVFKDTIDRQGDQENCGGNSQLPCASSIEEPLKVVTLAVAKSASTHQNFFRKDAALAVIILTDEDEKSFGGPSATKPNTVIKIVKESLNERKFLVNGLIIQPN